MIDRHSGSKFASQLQLEVGLGGSRSSCNRLDARVCLFQLARQILPNSIRLERRDDMARPQSSFRATPNAVHRLQKTLQKLALNDGDIEAEEVWHEEDTDRYVHLRMELQWKFLTLQQILQVISS